MKRKGVERQTRDQMQHFRFAACGLRSAVVLGSADSPFPGRITGAK